MYRNSLYTEIFSVTSIQIFPVRYKQRILYIDVLSVTWLANGGGDSRCYHCAGWSVTIDLM
jgi:hypothetical protein